MRSRPRRRCKTHPARAARVAILHGWTSTQTEGWWRQAFDIYRIPYDYIDPQTIRDTREPAREVRRHRASAPAAARRAVAGAAAVAEPDPVPATRPRRRTSAPGRRPTTRASGWGSRGSLNLQEFIDAGGVFLASNSSAEFAINNNFTYGVSLSRPGTGTRVVGSLLRTRLVDDTSPLVYGVPDNLAMYSDSGDTFSVSANVGGGGRGAAVAGAAAHRAAAAAAAPGRPTGRGTPDDPDVVQGRAGGRRLQPDAAAGAAAGAALAVRAPDGGAADAAIRRR